MATYNSLHNVETTNTEQSQGDTIARLCNATDTNASVELKMCCVFPAPPSAQEPLCPRHHTNLTPLFKQRAAPPLQVNHFVVVSPLPDTGAVGDGGGPSEREFAASRSFKESGCLGYWKDFFAASHPYR